MKGQENVFQVHGTVKQIDVDILIIGQINFKPKLTKREKISLSD